MTANTGVPTNERLRHNRPLRPVRADTRLSLRSVRFDEEAGMLAGASRSKGRFRRKEPHSRPSCVLDGSTHVCPQ